MVIVSILDITNRCISLVKTILVSSVTLSVLSLVIFFIFHNVSNDLKKYSYPPKAVKYLKIGIFLKWIFLIIPIIIIGITVSNEIKNVRDCNVDLKKTGLLIASFNDLRNNDIDDGFSSTLYGKLNADLQHIDTINLRQLKRYISENDNDYLDSIKKVFGENCSKSGLIVFGNRKGEKLFNCRIYSLNFLDFKSKIFFKTHDKSIIYIQNPDILDFTIEYEATTISKFIYGLLYYHGGNYELSNKSINKALQLNRNKENTQFISICHLFMGNNYLKEGKETLAINEYRSGSLIDSTNGYLHYNIAAVYRTHGKTEDAYSEYTLANKLNPELKNPLKRINTLTQLPKPKSLVKPHFLIKDTIKTNIGKDTLKSVLVKEKWNEQCFTILVNKKYGVINNNSDTLVKCKYDAIQSFVFKNSDCFIVRLGNKYGAVIHTHYDGGYTLSNIPVEFSSRTIRQAVERQVEATKVLF